MVRYFDQKSGKEINLPAKSETLPIKIEPMPSVASTTRTKLPSGGPSSGALRNLQILVEGSVTMDSSADGTITPEGVLSLIREIRVSGDSKDGKRAVGELKKIDFAAAYVMNLLFEALAGVKTNPASIAKSAANQAFAACVDLEFQMQFSNDPRKTLLNAAELENLMLELDWGTLAEITSTGVATAGSTAITAAISAKRYVDAVHTSKRYPFHMQRYKEKSLNGASTNFNFELSGKNLLRGILVKTFTRAAGVSFHTPVDTIVTKIEIKGDQMPIKAYDKLSQIKAENQKVYGVVPPTGYFFLDFMTEKNYDTLINEGQYGSIEVNFSVAAVSDGVVRVYPIELR